MEKTDPVEAAKYYVAYLQNQKRENSFLINFSIMNVCISRKEGNRWLTNQLVLNKLKLK